MGRCPCNEAVWNRVSKPGWGAEGFQAAEQPRCGVLELSWGVEGVHERWGPGGGASSCLGQGVCPCGMKRAFVCERDQHWQRESGYRKGS